MARDATNPAKLSRVLGDAVKCLRVICPDPGIETPTSGVPPFSDRGNRSWAKGNRRWAKGLLASARMKTHLVRLARVMASP